MATLTLTSISAERVPSGDTHSATDPYVRFALLNELGYFPTATRTSTLSNNANPVWTDTLKLTLPADWKGGSMKVCLWDADTKGDDDALGHCVVKLEPTGEPCCTPARTRACTCTRAQTRSKLLTPWLNPRLT